MRSWRCLSDSRRFADQPWLPHTNHAPSAKVDASAGWLQLDGNLVAAPIRFADPTAPSLLNEGDAIDVLAADGLGGSAVVASRVEVMALPSFTESTPLARDERSPLVVLAVTTTQATELAGASAVGPLSFVMHPGA